MAWELAAECDVCFILDGDERQKPVAYCSKCDAYICENCQVDSWRRFRAMLKRATKKFFHRIMFTTSLIAILASIAVCQSPPPPSAFEFPCPSGTSPLPPNGWTLDPSTNKYRAWVCVDVNGVVTLNGSGGSVAFSNITTGVNTQADMQVDDGATLTPLDLGQVTGNSLWFTNIDVQPSTGPSWTGANTGGSLISAHVYGLAFTLNSDIGETTSTATQAFQLTTHVPACVSSACTITGTGPLLPPTFTGATWYAQDQTNSQSLQRIAGCINITGNCTFGSIPTTVGPPTSNPVMTAPTNALASVCPPAVTPLWWVADMNGDFNSQAYVSQTTANAWIGGILTECRPHWFTDEEVDPPGGNNALVVIDHQTGNGGVSRANQDRALWVGETNPVNDSSTFYAMEGIQDETDFNCNGCTVNGSPDGEITSGSFQLQDNAATNYSPALGSQVIRAQYFKAGAGATTTESIIHAIYGINNHTYGFTNASGLFWDVAATGVQTNNLILSAVRMTFNSDQITEGQVGLYTAGSNPAGTNNFVVRNDRPGVPSNLNGIVTDAGESNNNVTAYPIKAPIAVTSSITTLQGTIDGAASANCTGGASQYSYVFVGIDNNGGQVASATQNTTSTCTNPLTVGNPVTISILNSFVSDTRYGTFIRIDVYRTAGPMATGKIGSLSCAAGQVSWGLSCTTFSDTGLSATGSVPTINTTGSIAAASFLKSGPVVFANLPACTAGTEGAMQAVTDSSTIVWGTTITGSSTHHVLAYCDGTNWTVAAI